MSSQRNHRTIYSRWPLRAGLAGLLTSSALSSSWAIDIAARLSPAALGQQADLRAGGATAAIQGGIGASWANLGRLAQFAHLNAVGVGLAISTAALAAPSAAILSAILGRRVSNQICLAFASL